MSPKTLAHALSNRITDLPEVSTWQDSDYQSNALNKGAIDALDAGKTHYTDRPGILPLRQWVANHLNSRYDVTVNPDEVTITCGGTEARFVSVKFLADEGANILSPGDPKNIEGAASLAGANILRQSDTSENIDILYLTPRDGKRLMQELSQLAIEYGWWVIWDMVAGGGDYHPAQNPALAPKVVSIGSLSDRIPGWRIGWLAGSEKASALKAFKQSITICSPSISQWAAIGMLEAE